MAGLYQQYKMNVDALDRLPIGTTISFFKDGKERYLRKIRTNDSFPYPWYSTETGQTIPSKRVPAEWSVLPGCGQANNIAQQKRQTRDKFRARYQY